MCFYDQEESEECCTFPKEIFASVKSMFGHLEFECCALG